MRLRNDNREQRIREGVERNTAWSALSVAQKLAALSKRPGKCARQVTKLQKETTLG